MSLLRKPAPQQAAPAVETRPTAHRPRDAGGGPLPAPVGGAGPLHVRLRPPSLNDVIGHKQVVGALRNLFKGKDIPHAFLFTGPSGTGKTTLARIIASLVGCSGRDSIVEIDAARYSGVDNMREIIAGSRFASLGDSPRKLIIVDEAHRLSRGAWDSMLLSIEEPPPHVWWVFCSTEPDKIPQTIRTRCHAFDLKPLAWEDIANYLGIVAASEGMLLPSQDIIGVIARRSMGSMRQALVFLSSVNGVADKQTALSLIESIEDDEGNPKQLARMICVGKNFSWENALKLVQAMKDESPETVRLIVVAYATSMLMESKNPQQLLAVLGAFRGPYNQSERHAPLLFSIGQLLF